MMILPSGPNDRGGTSKILWQLFLRTESPDRLRSYFGNFSSGLNDRVDYKFSEFSAIWRMIANS